MEIICKLRREEASGGEALPGRPSPAAGHAAAAVERHEEAMAEEGPDRMEVDTQAGAEPQGTFPTWLDKCKEGMYECCFPH